MDYRKIIPGRNFRVGILRMLTFVPDELMLKIQYRLQMGKNLNVKTPKTYTEKLQLYKMYYRNPVMHQCVDKYDVRAYVEGKGLGKCLNELYGVYDSVSEIDWDKLPNKFIIKTTTGGGGNNIVICNDKTNFDTNTVEERLNLRKSKKSGTFSAGREWAYTKIKTKIIVEKLLEGNDEFSQGLADYKIMCFQGEPKVVILDVDRYVNHLRNFYDTDWNNLNIQSDHEQINREIPRPENMEEMLNVARILSADFPHARIDLYNIRGKITFGEITFYPWSGYVKFQPQSFDELLGRYFDISSFVKQ